MKEITKKLHDIVLKRSKRKIEYKKYNTKYLNPQSSTYYHGDLNRFENV
jgi:hypothetical protein